MTTLEWTHIKLQTDMQAGLPAFLRPLLHYRLLLGGFGSDWHIAAIGHESFHAFQGMLAPDRVAAAEYANQVAAAYPWDDDTFRAAWATELDLLRQSMGAETDQEAAVVRAQAWLAAREARRQEAGLSTTLVDFERQRREWLEGLAKYAEMELWRRGATDGYRPVAAMTAVPGFHAYADFEQRWNSGTGGRWQPGGFGRDAVLLQRVGAGRFAGPVGSELESAGDGAEYMVRAIGGGSSGGRMRWVSTRPGGKWVLRIPRKR